MCKDCLQLCTDSKNIQVVLCGIITHDGTKNEYWVPYDKYRVIARNDATFPILNNLQVMHDKVLAGSFVDDRATPRISFSKYVDIDLGTTSLV